MSRLALSLLLLYLPLARAEEIAVPVEVQYPLFLKILLFDHNLHSQDSTEVLIGVAYQGKFRTSLEMRDKLLEVAAASPIKTIKGLSIRLFPLDLDRVDLAQALAQHRPACLYVTPLRAVALDRIAALCRSQKVVSLTGVPEYVRAGLAVGIDAKGERPQILINLEAARAEGAQFSARLLTLDVVELIK